MSNGGDIARKIHKWTTLKLEYLDHYLQAYVTATKKTVYQTYYIDAFAGPGDCTLIETGLTIEGSAWRALKCRPAFGTYWFIDNDRRLTNHLETRIQDAGIDNAKVYSGDCNVILPETVLSQIPRQAPGFAFLDPPGLQLHWQTIEALAAHRSASLWKMELLILFPFDMAVNQNLFNPGARNAVTLFFGSDEWEKELRASKAHGEDVERRRSRFTQLYVRSLSALGYRYVEEYGPLRWGNRPLYSVVFASDHPVGAKIMKDIWSKPRSIPGQLDYTPVRRPRMT